MRTSHVAGLVFLAAAALTQRQLINNSSRPARFVALEFKAEKQNP